MESCYYSIRPIRVYKTTKAVVGFIFRILAIILSVCLPVLWIRSLAESGKWLVDYTLPDRVNVKFSTPSQIPNPLNDHEACGRSSRSTICDPFSYLDVTLADSIQMSINDIVSAEIGVLVIKKMHPSLFEGVFSSVDKSAAKFAQDVHDTWGIGNKVTNNGILLFLSIEDRKVYISTGVGVQNHLSYGALGTIIEHMKPFLKQRQYGYAIQTAVAELQKALGSTNGLVYRIWSFAVFLLQVILVMAALFAFVIGEKAFEKWLINRDEMWFQNLGRGSDQLNTIMRELSDCESAQIFKSESCPICLESFTTEKMHPMALSCGHMFCKSCLKCHLGGSNVASVLGSKKCPICRTPVLKGCKGNNENSISHQEFQYRVNRLRYLYPDVITSDLANLASREGAGSLFQDAARLRVREVDGLVHARAAPTTYFPTVLEGPRFSGVGARFTSFGGGRSFGGRGGSW